jgi:hypothetical protein
MAVAAGRSLVGRDAGRRWRRGQSRRRNVFCHVEQIEKLP